MAIDNVHHRDKAMDLGEFADSGMLQEANRLFFHPLGLCLVVCGTPDNDHTKLEIKDYRDDPVGVLFPAECIQTRELLKKAVQVSDMRRDRSNARKAEAAKLGLRYTATLVKCQSILPLNADNAPETLEIEGDLTDGNPDNHGPGSPAC